MNSHFLRRMLCRLGLHKREVHSYSRTNRYRCTECLALLDGVF